MPEANQITRARQSHPIAFHLSVLGFVVCFLTFGVLPPRIYQIDQNWPSMEICLQAVFLGMFFQLNVVEIAKKEMSSTEALESAKRMHVSLRIMLVAVLDTFVFWNILEHCQIPCNHPKHIN